MRAADIERSSGTPALSRDDARLLASVTRALTPDVRDRQAWSEDFDFTPAQVQGDVLDMPPLDCWSWRWWWSRRNGEVGFARRPCGNRTCPTCAAGDLAARVAPAVKVWGARAIRAEYSPRQWKRKRDRDGLRMRGPTAESGVLVIRHGDTFAVWAPTHIVLDGGVVLRGQGLREQLVADLRAVPLPEWKPPKPRNGALPPIGLARTPEFIVGNAQAAGIPLEAGHRRYSTAPADDEQGRRFVELMRRERGA